MRFVCPAMQPLFNKYRHPIKQSLYMMKKLLYLLILPLCLSFSSCTMMVKGFAKLVVKDYNDYTGTNISNVQVVDTKGKSQSFGQAFAGKTVYLYLWKNKTDRAFETNENYLALQKRFAKYPDVVFANLYLGSDTAANAYTLGNNANAQVLLDLLSPSETAPFIIGKDGSILSYKGPKPSDNTLVDYVLFEARNGINGTKAAKKMIRSVNGEKRFKTQEMRDWYTQHFNKVPDGSVNFSVSSVK